MGFDDQMARFEKRLTENLKKIEKKVGDNVDNMFNSSNSFNSNSNSSITVNGVTISGGKNITMKNGEVWVDGVKVNQGDLAKGAKTNRGGFLDITIEGIAQSLTIDNSDKVTVGDIGGNVEVRNGALKCGTVVGSVEARNGAIECGNVGGSVSSRNGDVRHTVASKQPQDRYSNLYPKSYIAMVQQHYNNGGDVLVFKRGSTEFSWEQTVYKGDSFKQTLDWDNYFYSIQIPREKKTTIDKQTDDFCEIKE